MEILSNVVRDQANGNMNNYYPKTLLAKKIQVRKNVTLSWLLWVKGDSPKPEAGIPL